MSEVFMVEIPKNPEGMASFQEMMEKVHEATNKYVEQLAKELGVSEGCARDIAYLRTRSRHTPEKEQELIRLHAEGNPPNMCEF